MFWIRIKKWFFGLLPQKKAPFSHLSIETLAQIVRDYQLDYLETAGVRIQKTKHADAPEVTKTQLTPKTEPSPEDFLLWSQRHAGRF